MKQQSELYQLSQHLLFLLKILNYFYLLHSLHHYFYFLSHSHFRDSFYLYSVGQSNRILYQNTVYIFSTIIFSSRISPVRGTKLPSIILHTTSLFPPWASEWPPALSDPHFGLSHLFLLTDSKFLRLSFLHFRLPQLYVKLVRPWYLFHPPFWNVIQQAIKCHHLDFPGGPWLRICLSMQRTWVQSLV